MCTFHSGRGRMSNHLRFSIGNGILQTHFGSIVTILFEVLPELGSQID